MAEGSSSRREGKGTSSSSSAAQVGTSWPFKTALKFDERAKYCFLIFKASKEFLKHIVGVMGKENRKLLDEGYFVAISFHDVEKGKTYSMRMGRIHSSSFEESSKLKPKSSSSSGGKVKEQVSTEFVYTIGSERGCNPVIQDKLLYSNKFKEIGLRWSASNKDTLEFQVWYHEMVDLRTLF